MPGGMHYRTRFFPKLSTKIVYLNAAGATPLPAVTAAAGVEGVRKKEETPYDLGNLKFEAHRVKELFASLLGDSIAAEQLTIMPSTAYAMSLAAKNLAYTLMPGRAVLVLADQYPSNVLPWQKLCADVVAELRIVERPPNDDWTSAIIEQLERGDVAICTLPPCHWCDGSTVDLKRIGAVCRKHGTVFVVDATQYLGAGGELSVRCADALVTAHTPHPYRYSCPQARQSGASNSNRVP